MKFFIVLMFVVVIATALQIVPDWLYVFRAIFTPSIPHQSASFLLGVIGGVGGSVTLLSYSYWIKEKGWADKRFFRTIKIDLGVAYALTALFGIAIVILSAEVKPASVSGNKMVLALADKIGEYSGQSARWIFMLGFWGAVFSSMLGVWQGVPYLFSDFMKTRKTNISSKHRFDAILQNEKLTYRIFLIFIAVVPLLLLFVQKPVWIIVTYAIVGSFFMPFLAFSLLFLNNKKKKVGSCSNTWFLNLILLLALFVFGILVFTEINRLFF